MAASLAMMEGEAARGEYFAYQLGIFALQPLSDVRVEFSEMRSDNGKTIPATRSSCINTTGIGYDGLPFIKKIDIPAGQVQAFSCGIDIPAETRRGIYYGRATITSRSTPPGHRTVQMPALCQLSAVRR